MRLRKSVTDIRQVETFQLNKLETARREKRGGGGQWGQRENYTGITVTVTWAWGEWTRLVSSNAVKAMSKFCDRRPMGSTAAYCSLDSGTGFRVNHLNLFRINCFLERVTSKALTFNVFNPSTRQKTTKMRSANLSNPSILRFGSSSKRFQRFVTVWMASQKPLKSGSSVRGIRWGSELWSVDAVTKWI